MTMWDDLIELRDYEKSLGTMCFQGGYPHYHKEGEKHK